MGLVNTHVSVTSKQWSHCSCQPEMIACMAWPAPSPCLPSSSFPSSRFPHTHAPSPPSAVLLPAHPHRHPGATACGPPRCVPAPLPCWLAAGPSSAVQLRSARQIKLQGVAPHAGWVSHLPVQARRGTGCVRASGSPTSTDCHVPPPAHKRQSASMYASLAAASRYILAAQPNRAASAHQHSQAAAAHSSTHEIPSCIVFVPVPSLLPSVATPSLLNLTRLVFHAFCNDCSSQKGGLRSW